MTIRQRIIHWYATYGLIPAGWVIAVVAYLWLVLIDGRDWLNILVLEWFVITVLTFLNWRRHKSMRR